MYNVPNILSALYNEIRVLYEFQLLHSSISVQRSTLARICTKYQVQCTPPSAGRQDPSKERFGSEYESILCTSYLVLGT